MNRKNLTAAVLAGLAGAAGIVGSAQAVNINPDGLGQVLIYPYYTTNGDNLTVLSVVNTTDSAKAVKVRFKEGKNSREVLDFNLYMSAWDVWTAAVTNMDVDGVSTPGLIVNDNSCTVPYLYENEGGKQPFLVYGMSDTGVPDTFGDISRATEGYFEMIEMGVLADESASAVSATHVAGAMGTCQDLVDAWTIDDNLTGEGGYWNPVSGDPSIDIETPIGGLFGGAAIVNVGNGAAYSYDAKAINGFADAEMFGTLHGEPGFSVPSLNDGNIMVGKVFLDNGEVLTSSAFSRGIDAISYVFMHDQILNEYTTEAIVGAETEWVLTFPTKSHYVYQPESGSADAVAPFISTWDGAGACENVTLDTIWDRNERTLVTVTPSGEPIPPIVSPAPPDVVITPDPVIPFELCYEVSIIRYGAPMAVPAVEGFVASTPVLGSTNFHSIDNVSELAFDHGWARLQLADYKADLDDSGIIDPDEELTRDALGGLEGLPVTGFAVQRYVNGFLGDGANVLANYGAIYQHKATRRLGSVD